MHVYFSGVGGVGIGPLAMLALDSGYNVSGSDLQQSEMVSFLRDRGARVVIGQDGSQIANEHIEKPLDWFVYSSALPEDHPELKFAREHGIKISKRADFLNHLIDEKQLSLIAVAGTHGKTTTTGMLVWLFKQMGIPVSYSIGTSVNFGPPAQYQAGSEYFVYECDEFDRNFLEFKPYLSLVTSLDYDHPDTYPTSADYDYAFIDFLTQSKRKIMWQNDADHLNLKDEPSLSILSESDPGVSLVKLPGTHMRRNGWLAAQSLHELFGNQPMEDILRALAQFPGTNRRFEKLGHNLYTDYAHHPTEIAATIQMAKELNQKVVVVYQPHQNVRQHELAKEGGYKGSLEGVEKVYWLPTYLSREDSALPVLTPKELITTATNGSDIVEAGMSEQLWQAIEEHRKNGTLVICMSAGDLDHWLRQML